MNAEQCTISQYIDDNIISHKSKGVIDNLIKKIDAKFPGTVVENRPKQKFLGIDLLFHDDGIVDICTVQFRKKMIKEFKDKTEIDLNRTYTTTVAMWLFEIKESKHLCPKFTSFFHKYVMKVLWSSKGSRPDLEITMGILMTRVQKSNKDDWHKLMRLMSFIKATVDNVRTIGVDDLHHLLTLIDSAHVV